jgi:histone-lysine N-methyltransferase ASH1L
MYSPFSQKNVQECRCGSANCRGILGPRPNDQRPKESKTDDKKKSKTKARKGGKSTLAGTKRKLGNVLDESTSRLNKKRKLLNPKSIKAGVKKAVSKARTSVSSKARATQTKKTTTTKKTVKKVTVKVAMPKHNKE